MYFTRIFFAIVLFTSTVNLFASQPPIKKNADNANLNIEEIYRNASIKKINEDIEKLTMLRNFKKAEQDLYHEFPSDKKRVCSFEEFQTNENNAMQQRAILVRSAELCP